MPIVYKSTIRPTCTTIYIFQKQRAFYCIAFSCFVLATYLHGQGLSPQTPAKEYIRLNGQVIVVEVNGGTTNISQSSPNMNDVHLLAKRYTGTSEPALKGITLQLNSYEHSPISSYFSMQTRPSFKKELASSRFFRIPVSSKKLVDNTNPSLLYPLPSLAVRHITQMLLSSRVFTAFPIASAR